MCLTPCHSRVEFESAGNEFFCTHPRVIAENSRVARKTCKTCPLYRTAPPQTFRLPPYGNYQSGSRERFQLVVAHFRESLDWLEELKDFDTIIYEKDSSHPDALPNVGREAHTYLHHIIENYYDLAEVTVFLQGDPRDHIPDLTTKIHNVHRDIGYRDLGNFILIEDENGFPVQPGLRLRPMYEALFDHPAPSKFLCHCAACFAVSKENILQHPKSFYENAMRLLLESRLGPWEIERMWQFIFKPKQHREAIVTAADAGYFGHLQILLNSLQELTTRPIVIIDLGLTDEQKRECLECSQVEFLTLPGIYDPVLKLRKERMWQTWLKPYFIYHVPYDRVVWLDADCFAIRDVDSLFDELKSGPLFFHDVCPVDVSNHPKLYQLLKSERPAPSAEARVNAGVLALDTLRDHDLLAHWSYAVLWAGMNDHHRSMFSWHDQGALLWALNATGNLQRIRQETTWNHPMLDPHSLIHRAIKQRRPVSELLREQLPDVHVTHWLGIFKLKQILEEELQRQAVDFL